MHLWCCFYVLINTLRKHFICSGFVRNQMMPYVHASLLIIFGSFSIHEDDNTRVLYPWILSVLLILLLIRIEIIVRKNMDFRLYRWVVYFRDPGNIRVNSWYIMMKEMHKANSSIDTTWYLFVHWLCPVACGIIYSLRIYLVTKSWIMIIFVECTVGFVSRIYSKRCSFISIRRCCWHSLQNHLNRSITSDNGLSPGWR